MEVSKSFREISGIIHVKDVDFFQWTLHTNCGVVTLGNDKEQCDQRHSKDAQI